MRYVGVGFWALCVLANAEIPSSCCSELRKIPQLNGAVYMSGTIEYKERLDTYYSANAALHSSCMVMPRTTEDVSALMSVITTHQCQFGMGSGKHSAYRNSNAVEDGITVDFGYMNQTWYDTKTKIASIKPGSNWGEVYKALEPYGVTAVGGRASPVGVGGFITGGGYSFHANVRGLVAIKSSISRLSYPMARS
ncbi:hypothetical protein NXS19_002723 [Fusarium pseudograminearum]|nr:hypothetical protein NXS19_002723 [Fusarium pseudograminearum]